MKSYDKSVVAQVAEHLGNYVYLLVDPRDQIPFYVGKGVGTRMLAHSLEAELLGEDHWSTKHTRIHELAQLGKEPEIWIARYGLDSTYTQVEAALIDFLQTFPVKVSDQQLAPLGATAALTNKRREAAKGHGIVRLEQFMDEFAAPELASATPLLLITLKDWVDAPEGTPGGGTRAGHGFKRSWLDQEVRGQEIGDLADSTRCWWYRLSERTVALRGVEHVVAVHRKVTRALFQIIPGSWEKSGQRSGFALVPVTSGPLFDEVVGQHGHRVPEKYKGLQVGYRYYPAPSPATPRFEARNAGRAEPPPLGKEQVEPLHRRR